MSMGFDDSVVITNPAGTEVYDGFADLQDNSDRFRTDKNGLLVDLGDGRCFLPVKIGALSPIIEQGHSGAATLRDGRTVNVAVGRVDRLDDSFSYTYDD